MRTAAQEAAFQASVRKYEAESRAAYERDPLLRAKVAQVAHLAEYDEKGRARADWCRRMREACKKDERTTTVPDPMPVPVEAWTDTAARAACLESVWFGDEDPISETSEELRAKACVYLGLCREETGNCVPEEKIKERRADAETLTEQTHAMAKKLSLAGIDVYRETPFRLYKYYVHSGHTEELPMFRRCVFLPLVAQALRMPMLQAVEAFLQRNRHCRFWTFTTGKRCPLQHVRKRVSALHRRLSKLNAQPWMQSAGVQIVLRSTELGTPEFDVAGNKLAEESAGRLEFDDQGNPLFHVHAHCVIYLSKGRIKREKWSRLIQKVRKFWRYHMDVGKRGESGVIRNAREAVKYVTKPGDLLRLSSTQLAALWHELRRMKLLQGMGAMAEFTKDIEESGEKLVSRRVRNGEGRIYERVKNWNKRGKATRREKDMLAAEKLAQRTGKDVQSVVSRLLPSAGPSCVKEAAVIVLSTRFDVAALKKNPLVTEIVVATADEFRAGLAISVHTCTSTVRQTDPLPFPDPLPIPKMNLTGAEMAGYSR